MNDRGESLFDIVGFPAKEETEGVKEGELIEGNPKGKMVGIKFEKDDDGLLEGQAENF